MYSGVSLSLIPDNETHNFVFVNWTNSFQNIGGLVTWKIKAIPVFEILHTKKGSTKLIHSYVRQHMIGLVIQTNHG